MHRAQCTLEKQCTVNHVIDNDKSFFAHYTTTSGRWFNYSERWIVARHGECRVHCNHFSHFAASGAETGLEYPLLFRSIPWPVTTWLLGYRGLHDPGCKINGLLFSRKKCFSFQRYLSLAKCRKIAFLHLLKEIEQGKYGTQDTGTVAKMSAKYCYKHDDIINGETFSALLAICAENSPVTGEFPVQRPVIQSFDVFFDLRLNKRLSKQP